MPTGNTAKLHDGEQSFEEFVLGCARAMGALITMKEAPADASIPDAIEVGSYYVEAVARAEAAYAHAKAMTLERAETLASIEYEEALAYYQREVKQRTARRDRYELMRSRVEAWEPPTEDHVEFRTFMLGQLDLSMAGCQATHLPEPVRRTAEECRATKIEVCERALRQATESLAEEQARAEVRTAWLVALRESLTAKSDAEDRGPDLRRRVGAPVSDHPEWAAVGAEVEVMRGHGRGAQHRRQHTVARHTRTLIVLDNGDRFKARTYGYNGRVQYEMTPAYLDYWTRLEPVGGGASGD